MKKLSLLFCGIFLLSVTAFAQREQDSLALVEFYNSTQGDQWTDNSNWLSAAPISEWKGITLKNNRVSQITFYQNNLNGTLPAAIGSLDSLTSLVILSNPNLGGSLPTEIGNLSILTRLTLHGDNFSGTLPTSLGNLTKLTELTLSNNAFSGSFPDVLGNLVNLTDLDLSENQFSGALPSAIGNLILVEDFNIGENDFDALPAELTQMTALVRLYLYDNAFTSIPDLSGLSKLRYVSVGQNYLDFEDLDGLNLDTSQTSITYEDQKTRLPISSSVSASVHTIRAEYTYAGTLYQWQKDNRALDNETNAELYVNDTEIGIYDYTATHPDWPDLTLESDFVMVGDLHGGVTEADSLALVSIYQNTDGDNWYTTNSSYFESYWLSTEPISRWYGVEIDNGRVIKLQLNENNLTGTFPTATTDLSALTVLDYSSNNLSGEIPSNIDNLTQLTFLDLSENQFSGSIPTQIGNLSLLQELYLSENNFTGSLPAEINNLSALTHLYLKTNQFSGAFPDISALTALSYLSISENAFTQLPDLSALSALSLFYLADNGFDFEDFDLAQINWENSGYYYSPQNYNLPYTAQTSGDAVTLTVTYDYVGTSYQWYKDKQPLTNETAKTLSFPETDLGVYQCKAQNTVAPDLTLSTETYINGSLHGGVLLSDSLALVAFYNATNGDSWTDNTNWLSTEAISTWKGVSVTDGRVSKLSLTENNLSGTLPAEIGDLNYLEEIVLWDNVLTGEIPTEIGNLNNIEGLYLNSNQFSGSIPLSISQMTSLTDLWLQSNDLSGSLPAEIGDMSQLMRLYAYNNQLSGNIPTSFGQLQNLYVLLLSNNQLSGSLPVEMTNMSGLRYFEIDHNQLSGLCDLSVLPELSSLYVENNLLDFEDIETVQVDWSGYYFKYNPQDLILPVLESDDGSNYTLEVDYAFAGVSYQWYKNDAVLDGETNQQLSFAMSQTGDYYCAVNYATLPDLTLYSETITIGTVGIEKPETGVSKVYPNPARDFVKIEAEKAFAPHALLQLKNMAGATLLEKNIEGQAQIELQLSTLPKGIYFLQINNNGQTFVQKLIVE